MTNIEPGGQNAEVERAVKLLELRERDNTLAKKVAVEMKITALPGGVRALAERRLALRRQQAAVPAAPMPARPASREEEALANIEALTRAKEEKSRAKATLDGTIRHLPGTIEAVSNTLEESGMIEAVSAATDVAMPGVGTAIVQAPKVAAAPFKIKSTVEAERKRKEIDTIASEAESTLQAGDEVMSRSDVEARAAVRRQKGNPDRMRWQSGRNQKGQSPLTGQNQYWSDDPPAAEPEKRTSDAAAGNARDIAAELEKKRNKKLVDAGTAFVPKLDEFLKLRRMVRDNGWTAIQNEQKRLALATELLELAYRHDDDDSLRVMEELVPDKKEREKLRMLYSSPITEGTAAARLAEKLAGRLG